MANKRPKPEEIVAKLLLVELLLILCVDVLWRRTQGILNPLIRAVDPNFDLGRRQIIGSAGFRHRGLALIDLDNQGGLSLRCLTFDRLVHTLTHGFFLLLKHGQEISGSVQVIHAVSLVIEVQTDRLVANLNMHQRALWGILLREIASAAFRSLMPQALREIFPHLES